MKLHELLMFISSAAAVSSMAVTETTVVAEPEQTTQSEPQAVGNPQNLTSIPCLDDTSCEYSQTCHNNQCIFACKLRDGVAVTKRCGKNAFCYIGTPHIASCGCYPTHTGDPDSGCLQHTDFLSRLVREGIQLIWETDSS